MNSVLNIGITCYHGNNKHKFKRMLASLFVTPNILSYENIVNEYSNLIKIITEKISNNNKTNYELIKLCVKSWFEKGIQFNDEFKITRIDNYILIKNNDTNLQLQFNDELIKLILLITDSNSHFSINNDNLFVYNNTLICYVGQILCCNIVKKYIDLNHKFETIKEYIDDMLQYDFIYDKPIPNNLIEFTFLIDGYSGIKYESFERFYHSLQKQLFDKICPNEEYISYKLKPDLKSIIKEYFENEYNNTYENTSELIGIIQEFKTLTNHVVKINGTKYKNLVQINRNIFMMKHENSFIQFLDDDDFSSSIFQRYTQAMTGINLLIENDNRIILIDLITSIEKCRKYIAIKRKQKINLINTYDLMKLDYYQFRQFMKKYCGELIRFIFNGKIDYKNLTKIYNDKSLNTLRIRFKHLYDEYKSCDMTNQMSGYIYEKRNNIMSGFWSFTIQPFTLNIFSVIDDLFGEDYIFRSIRDEFKSSTSVLYPYPFYYYLETTNSNGLMNSNKCKLMLKWVYNAGLTCNDLNDYEKNNYGSDEVCHYYNWDSKIEWFNGVNYNLEYIADIYWK